MKIRWHDSGVLGQEDRRLLFHRLVSSCTCTASLHFQTIRMLCVPGMQAGIVRGYHCNADGVGVPSGMNDAGVELGLHVISHVVSVGVGSFGLLNLDPLTAC